MLSQGRKLLVLGGQQDTGGKLVTKWWRKDLLIYDPTTKAWQPPIKNVFVSSKSYRELVAEHVLMSGEQLYIIYRGSNSRHNQEREEVLFIDRLSTRYPILVNCFHIVKKYSYYIVYRSVLRIRDPVLFYPPDPGWSNGRIRIRDPG
jgi:hypothetical protein